MKYSLMSVSDDGTESVSMTLDTKEETWGAPMNFFLQFLKAQGFSFDLNDEIGMYNSQTDNFRSATDE